MPANCHGIACIIRDNNCIIFNDWSILWGYLLCSYYVVAIWASKFINNSKKCSTRIVKSFSNSNHHNHPHTQKELLWSTPGEETKTENSPSPQQNTPTSPYPAKDSKESSNKSHPHAPIQQLSMDSRISIWQVRFFLERLVSHRKLTILDSSTIIQRCRNIKSKK